MMGWIIGAFMLGGIIGFVACAVCVAAARETEIFDPKHRGL